MSLSGFFNNQKTLSGIISVAGDDATFDDIEANTATITTVNASILNATAISSTSINNAGAVITDDIDANTGNITTLNSTDVNATNLTGTIQTASQPNITSVGVLPSATINTLTSTTVNTTTGNFTDITFSGYILGGTPGAYNLSISSSGSVSFNFVFSKTWFQAFTGYGYQIRDSGGTNRNVLTIDTLGSTVVNSSLTSVGTLTGGLNIASGQTYKINSVAILSATTLGSSVVNSSLTSVGTLTSLTTDGGDITVNNGDIYADNFFTNFNSGAYYIYTNKVLSQTDLGTTVVNCSLRNIVPSTNQLFIGDVSSNTYLEITPSNCFIDFISSGVGSTDYNARIRCTGGTATAGSGTLTYTATTHNFIGAVNSTTGRITNSAVLDNAFLHSIATAQIYTKSFTALNSAMTNGQNVQISFGKAQTTNNCVEIGHAYDGTTPANNKCTFGFYGNGPIMSYNQSGTVTIGNFNMKPNTKEDATLNNSTQLGSVATQTTLANITFTSNNQSSYVCSASSNSSTAYRAFGTSASNWASTSNIYDATGVYTGTANIITANGLVTYGEYIQIQLPMAYVLKGATWTNTPDSNPSRALTYNIYGSSSAGSGTWYIIHQGTTGGSSTTTVTNFDTISQFNYFVLQVKSMTDGGTGFNCTLNLDALTITAFNYSELVYLPQALEIGDSTTASIPNDTLTVNGTSRLKGLVVSEDYTTLNGAVDGNANFSLTGFLFKYRKICAKVTVSNATAFTANTSFWASTRSPSITYDNTFTSQGTLTGYGMIITTGTYNGMYRAYYAGIYKVCINGRCADVATGNIGVMPKTYNGTTFVNIFPDDGVYWIAQDGNSRRSFNFAFDISLASGTAVFLTPYTNNNQSWATMSVEFVSST